MPRQHSGGFAFNLYFALQNPALFPHSCVQSLTKWCHIPALIWLSTEALQRLLDNSNFIEISTSSNSAGFVISKENSKDQTPPPDSSASFPSTKAAVWPVTNPNEPFNCILNRMCYFIKSVSADFPLPQSNKTGEKTLPERHTHVIRGDRMGVCMGCRVQLQLCG